MQRILIIVFILISFLAEAQLTIVINSVPDYTPPEDDIFLAGDLNSWNPADPAFKLEKMADSSWKIVLPEMVHGKVILFKFTRGSWETVEKGTNGEEINDRHYTFGNGGIINPIILNWADNGNGGGGSTASENVSIMDDSFYMPQLDRNRRIWIYLPPDYNSYGKRYPVIYMHDGQNLFDAQTSFAGEWEIDETLDNIFSPSTPVPIVVGVDNGSSHRIDEYTPWVNQQYGGGDGELYVDFIVETLKPFIDANYRTISDRQSTAIMGSSLGGLISHYGALKNQDIFGKIGIFSPSYWWSDSIWAFTITEGKQEDMMIYQMCGDQESGSTVTDMQEMDTYLKDLGFDPNAIVSKVVVGGQHNEKLWREEFEEAYLWLFSDYISTIDEHKYTRQLTISPNPANNIILFNDYKPGFSDSILIVDAKGSVVVESYLNKNSFDISKLASGVYIVKIIQKDTIYEGKFVKR